MVSVRVESVNVLLDLSPPAIPTVRSADHIFSLVILHKATFLLCPHMPNSALRKKILEVILLYKNAESSGAFWGYGGGAVNGAARGAKRA